MRRVSGAAIAYSFSYDTRPKNNFDDRELKKPIRYFRDEHNSDSNEILLN